MAQIYESFFMAEQPSSTLTKLCILRCYQVSVKIKFLYNGRYVTENTFFPNRLFNYANCNHILYYILE